MNAFLLTVVAVLAAALTAGANPLPPGSYRLDLRIVSRARLPMLGEQESTQTSTSLVQIAREDSGLRQTHRVCAVGIEGGIQIVRLEMPPRFIAALGDHAYPVTLVEDGDGWRYRADLGEEHVGYRPGTRDVLPREADDPAVYDSDGDGRPGATLALVVPMAHGELYVVQRGHSILNGRLVGSARVEGSVDIPLFEQAVIGARPAFLRRTPEIRPDPARSRFLLQPVAAGSTCADLVAAPGSAQ